MVQQFACIQRLGAFRQSLEPKFVTVQPGLFGDNLAVIDFIHGRGAAKGVRHMKLRMWYIREQYQMGNVTVEHMAGDKLVADKLTKLGDHKSHAIFTIDLLGLHLLGISTPEDFTAFIRAL